MITASDIIKKHNSKKLVLIASRRTDIPAFHLDYLIKGLKEERFILRPPMHRAEEFQFKKDDIHSVGVWSQDFTGFLENYKAIKKLGFNFWYRFTILPDDDLLKPAAPPVQNQLEQLESLIEKSKCIDPVFLFIDPIAVYKKINKKNWMCNYLPEKIEPIIKKASSLGFKDITISFLDYYKKIEKRCLKNDMEFKFFDSNFDADRVEMVNIVKSIKKVTGHYKVNLKSCCEKFLNSEGLALKGSCVDGNLLNKIYGAGASILQDKGQRKKYGCGCTCSLDVGSYSQACAHVCPQCYARS